MPGFEVYATFNSSCNVDSECPVDHLCQNHVCVPQPDIREIEDEITKLGKKMTTSLIGDPVHAGIGNYIYSKRLFAYPGKGLPLVFEVNYNSMDIAYNGPLGYGWTHAFNAALTVPTTPSTVFTIKWGDGHTDAFNNDGSGTFTPVNSNPSVTLTMPDVSHYLATLHNKNTYLFDSSGRLVSIADLNGNQIALTYSVSAPNQIDHITDTAGRQVAFTYDGSGRITSMAGPLLTVSFQYDGAGNLTGIVDPRGRTWGFTYAGSHRLLTQINAKGTTVVTNAYNAQGRVSQQTDGAGNITTYAYTTDASGTTTVITPASGHAVTQKYNLAHDLTSTTDGEGNRALFYTDAQGRLFNATDKNGGAVQIAYDANNNPRFVQDRTQGPDTGSQFAFNAQNRPTAMTDPLNHTTSFTYDANGNLTGITNPAGANIGIAVNGSGLPTTVTDALGKQWSYAYNSSGLPQTATDPRNAQTGFIYDTAGRLTQVTLPGSVGTVQSTYDAGGNLLTRADPLGYVTSFTYDNNGNIATRTFVPNGASTTYSYDWADRLISITDALSGVTAYAYDSDGNLSTVTDPDGKVLTRQYDRSGRLTALVDALGHHVYYGYDANGNITTIRDELNNTWTTTYDAEGKPLQITNPLNNRWTTAYDVAGLISSTTNPLNRRTTYQYDAANRLTSTTAPDLGVVSNTYNAAGMVTAMTDPLSHAWGFSYDDAGNLSAKTDPNGNSEGYVSDAMGRITQKTLRGGAVISYAYNGNSRITSMTLPGPATVTYGYNAAGDLTSMTDATGTTTMTYDLLGRRLTRTDPGGKTVAFSYTPAGRLATMTYPGNHVVTYTYDMVGRLSALTDWASNQTTFQYDSVNRVTQINLPNATRTLFTYDNAGHVKTRIHQKSDNTVIASYNYTYDAVGHITAVQRTEPATPNLAGTTASYTYDPVNRILTATVNSVSTTFTFDLKGNLTSKAVAGGATTTYTHDALDRLISVSDGTNTTNYTYDAASDRTVKAHNAATSRYVREGGLIWSILDGAGNVQSYNIYAGALLYSLDGSGVIRVYHDDERGSVVAVTDASQAVVQSYSYGPYGKVLGSSGSLNNAFQYVGTHGVMADENGLYHMQARYYDPEAKRFITEDPLGLEAGINLYGYASGDPIGRIDPHGTYDYAQLRPSSSADNSQSVGDWFINYKWTPSEYWLENPEVILENYFAPVAKAVSPSTIQMYGPGGVPIPQAQPGLMQPLIAKGEYAAETINNAVFTGNVTRNMIVKDVRTWASTMRSRTLATTTGLVTSARLYGAYFSTLGGTSVTSLTAAEIVPPVVIAAGGGWVAGRFIGKYSPMYSFSKGKLVTVDEWYQDMFAPMMKLPDDGDPVLNIRKWCKDKGINYNDQLSKNPNTW